MLGVLCALPGAQEDSFGLVGGGCGWRALGDEVFKVCVECCCIWGIECFFVGEVMCFGIDLVD